MAQNNLIVVTPMFLLGSRASFLSDDKKGCIEVTDPQEQEKRVNEIIQHINFPMNPAVLVREEGDLSSMGTGADVYVVFAHTMTRFSSLMILAHSGVPIILTGEEGFLGTVLDTFEYLAEYRNVRPALTYEEVQRSLRLISAAREVRSIRVCVFDSSARHVEDLPWLTNLLFKNILNVHYVDMDNFNQTFVGVDRKEAEHLAKTWVGSCTVEDVSLGDVINSARVYSAMKKIIEEMGAGAAYVLWCGQFTQMLGTKMCFAITILNESYPTGCWRGGNLLPMLILHSLSGDPVFFGEVHTCTVSDDILSIHHCAVPRVLSSQPVILKKWRDMEGTVTGYCTLPEGEVTLLGTGTDSLIAMRGQVIDCRDLGGKNCRTTVWIKLAEKAPLRSLVGREIAFCYGNYCEDVQELGTLLGISTIV